MKYPWCFKNAPFISLYILFCIHLNVSHASQLTASAELWSAYNILDTPYALDGTYYSGLPYAEVNVSANGTTDGLPADAAFTGTAKASADYSGLKTYISANVTNYQHFSFTYLWENYDPDIGTFYEEMPGTLSTATAQINDTFIVNSSVNGVMHILFDISGNMSSSNYSAIDSYTSFTAAASPTPTIGGSGWSYGEGFTDSVSKSLDLAIPYFADQATDVRFTLYSYIWINDGAWTSDLPDPYSFFATTDFFNTAALSEILLTDDLGNPLQGATITALSGTEYPLSALNAVPIPSALWLFVSGLLALIGVVQRKRAM